MIIYLTDEFWSVRCKMDGSYKSTVCDCDLDNPVNNIFLLNLYGVKNTDMLVYPESTT